MRRTLLHSTFALLAIVQFPADAHGQGQAASPAPAFVAIFDLRTQDAADLKIDTATGEAAMFPLSKIYSKDESCYGLPEAATPIELGRLLTCATDENVPIDVRAKAASLIADAMDALRDQSVPRAVSRKGTIIRAFAIQNATIRKSGSGHCHVTLDVVGRKTKFGLKEDLRETKIAGDMDALSSLVKKLGARASLAPTPPAAAPPAGPPPPPCIYDSVESSKTAWLTGRDISLTLERATVTLEATLLAAPTTLQTGEKGEDFVKTTVKAIADKKAVADLQKEDTELAEKIAILTCPLKADEFADPIARAICLYQANDEAGVEMIAKLTTPKRAALLRWILQNTVKPAIEVKAGAALGAALSAAPAEDKDEDKPKEITGSAKFLSGPKEHWSLSANAFVNGKTRIMKDGASSIELAETPPEFYVSLNYLIGDLHSSERELADDFELKFLVKAAKSPLDSLGVGLGLRGIQIKKLGIDFETLSPFAGMTWTRADKTQKRQRDVQVRFGVSLDLEKALDWVK